MRDEPETQRRLSEAELLRLKLAEERVRSSRLALRVMELEAQAVAQAIGLVPGDCVGDDGSIKK